MVQAKNVQLTIRYPIYELLLPMPSQGRPRATRTLMRHMHPKIVWTNFRRRDGSLDDRFLETAEDIIFGHTPRSLSATDISAYRNQLDFLISAPVRGECDVYQHKNAASRVALAFGSATALSAAVLDTLYASASPIQPVALSSMISGNVAVVLGGAVLGGFFAGGLSRVVEVLEDKQNRERALDQCYRLHSWSNTGSKYGEPTYQFP